MSLPPIVTVEITVHRPPTPRWRCVRRGVWACYIRGRWAATARRRRGGWALRRFVHGRCTLRGVSSLRACRTLMDWGKIAPEDFARWMTATPERLR